MSDNSNKDAGGDDRGRNPRNVKDLLKICAEASSNSESTDEVRSFETMTKEVVFTLSLEAFKNGSVPCTFYSTSTFLS